jgi:hypothetical protein
MLTIIIVLAYEDGPVLDSRAFMELEVLAKALRRRHFRFLPPPWSRMNG